MDRIKEHEKWLELPEEFRTNVVKYLNAEIPHDFFDGLRAEFKKNPKEWWAKGGWHFGQGMTIRNMLRKGGFTDDQLGEEGNWDDYYIQALEEAAGVAPNVD